MKQPSLRNVIDPAEPPSALQFEFEDNDVPELPDDSYVIGEDGNEIREVDLQALSDAEPHAKRWTKPAAFGLVVLFVVLSIWNAAHFIQGPPEPPKPTPFRAKQALYLGVMKLDAYRRVHGVLPDSLAEAGLPVAEGYAYQRVNPTRYVLSFRNGGAKLEYDSSDSKENFFGSPKDVLNMGDAQ